MFGEYQDFCDNFELQCSTYCNSYLATLCNKLHIAEQ